MHEKSYWLRKILALPLILLVASFLIFWAVRLLPGDPARLMAGMQADQKVVNTVRSRLGLDKPFAMQYEIFLRMRCTAIWESPSVRTNPWPRRSPNVFLTPWL